MNVVLPTPTSPINNMGLRLKLSDKIVDEIPFFELAGTVVGLVTSDSNNEEYLACKIFLLASEYCDNAPLWQ